MFSVGFSLAGSREWTLPSLWRSYALSFLLIKIPQISNWPEVNGPLTRGPVIFCSISAFSVFGLYIHVTHHMWSLLLWKVSSIAAVRSCPTCFHWFLAVQFQQGLKRSYRGKLVRLFVVTGTCLYAIFRILAVLCVNRIYPNIRTTHNKIH